MATINTATTWPAIKTQAFYGDSIFNGFLASNAFHSCSYLIPLQAARLNQRNLGVGGTTVVNVGGTDTTSLSHATRIATVTGIAHLDRVVILGGTNDANQLYNSGNNNYSLANFNAAYQTMLARLTLNGTTTYQIDCWGLLLPNYVTTAQVANFNAQIQAAITSFKTTYPAQASLVRYIDTTNFWNGSGTPPHPDDNGYLSITTAAIPFWSSPAYTISGPATGVAGQASAAFTVALANTGRFNAQEAITLSDGGQGGTFTPSVGSPGTGTVTVTPANNATSFTFTYNAASAGTKTLTASNNALLVDPSAASMLAQSPVIASAMFFAA